MRSGLLASRAKWTTEQRPSSPSGSASSWTHFPRIRSATGGQGEPLSIVLRNGQ
jgi:hypothetical protein